MELNKTERDYIIYISKRNREDSSLGDGEVIIAPPKPTQPVIYRRGRSFTYFHLFTKKVNTVNIVITDSDEEIITAWAIDKAGLRHGLFSIEKQADTTRNAYTITFGQELDGYLYFKTIDTQFYS
jgi:hypothetical protein